MAAKPHNDTIDFLRFFSILAVVLIHTTTRTLEASHFDVVTAGSALFLNQIARFAVPLFFAISGFVLETSAQHHFHLASYIKKRLSRILIPYIFWSAVYYFFIYTHHGRSFPYVLVFGEASYQLYFIPTLLIFYAIFPLIHRFLSIFTHKLFLILLGLLEIYLLYRSYYFLTFKFDLTPLNIAVFNYFPFLLGITAAAYSQAFYRLTTHFKKVLLVLVALLMIYVSWEGQHNFLKTKNYLTFYSQWRPSILFYSLGFGCLFYALISPKIAGSVFIKHLSRLSFFVFFIHVIVLELSWTLVFRSLFSLNSSWLVIFNLLYFLSVVIISYLIAFITSKIKFIHYLTG